MYTADQRMGLAGEGIPEDSESPTIVLNGPDVDLHTDSGKQINSMCIQNGFLFPI